MGLVNGFIRVIKSPEILLIAAYFGILYYCSPRDITQLCCGDKCFSLLYTSWHFERLYDSPIYTALSWLSVRVGVSDGFALSLFLSMFPSVGSAICVALIVRRKTKGTLCSSIAVLTLMSSWIFFSQAIKVEVYPITAFIIILAYTFLVYERYTLSAIFFGFGTATHWISGFLAVLAWLVHSKGLRKRWYVLAVVSLVIWVCWYTFVSAYSSNTGGGLAYTFISSWTVGPLSEVLSNIGRTIPILLFLATFGWIPICVYFKKNWIEAIPIMFILAVPVSYMIVAISDSGYTQMTMVAPFLSVAAGCGIKYVTGMIRYVVFVGLLAVIILHPFVWNIDTNPTTARDLIEQLGNLPDNAKIAPLRIYNGKNDTFGGFVFWTVDYYNMKTGGNITVLDFEGRPKLLENGGVDYSKFMDDLKMEYGSVYYYEIVDKEKMRCVIKEW